MPTTMTANAHARLSSALQGLEEDRVELINTMATIGRGDDADKAQAAIAREELARLDGRIRDLRNRLQSAVIAEPVAGGDIVVDGALIEVLFAGEDAPERYLISAGGDLVDDATTISPSAPLAAALVGHSAGDEVRFASPAGEQRVKVHAIL